MRFSRGLKIGGVVGGVEGIVVGVVAGAINWALSSEPDGEGWNLLIFVVILALGGAVGGCAAAAVVGKVMERAGNFGKRFAMVFDIAGSTVGGALGVILAPFVLILLYGILGVAYDSFR